MKKHRQNTEKKGRVVLVSPSSVDRYPPVQYQARILANNGAKVHLLTAPMSSTKKVEFAYPGVEVHSFHTEHASKIVRLFSLLAMAICLTGLRRTKPEMEIDFDPIGVVVGEWARGKANTLLHHHHEVLFDDDRGRHIPKARAALPKADLVAVADERRRALMMSGAPAPRQCITVRNAPMTTDVLLRPAARDELFSIVYFGSVGPAQCLDTVIHSMKDWPDHVSLHLYGAKPTGYAKKLRSLSNSLGVSERFIFEPWVATNELLKTISRHHLALTLLRPLNDNWRYSAGASNKRFLAMAAGLPQISDNGLGVEELVAHTNSGVCVDPNDASAIAEAVNTYISNPARVETDGKNGRACIVNGLNYEQEFSPIIDMLNSTGARVEL